MKVECESCKKEINLKTIEVKDIIYKEGKRKRVWFCSNCNYEYLITITSEETRKLMKENKEDSKKVGKMNKQSDTLKTGGSLDQDKLDRHMIKVTKITDRIDKRKKEIDKLSKEMIEEYKKEEEQK